VGDPLPTLASKTVAPRDEGVGPQAVWKTPTSWDGKSNTGLYAQGSRADLIC